jgi:hypothetical protein
MTTTALAWTDATGWQTAGPIGATRAQLVLYFGQASLLEDPAGPLRDLRRRYPHARLAGCSTSGEIFGGTVRDGSIAALAVEFRHSSVRTEAVAVAGIGDSFAAAAELGRRLAGPDLRHVFLLSDGLAVNGTALTEGIRAALPGVSVTGGLAGDGPHFQRTVVGLDGDVGPHRVVAVGFYGARLRVSADSAGGWDPFGPHRLITKSEGNVLFELNGQPALPLYKRYLGERAAGLPATGLLFPLSLLADRDAECGLIRTILAVDEARQSLTFAGDLPLGRYVRLMRASGDALIGGAGQAAERLGPPAVNAGFALLVSCVGRKLVLGQRIDEEVEAVRFAVGNDTPALGFYSYGEIGPNGDLARCELHNQTMTVTLFSEDV